MVFDIGDVSTAGQADCAGGIVGATAGLAVGLIPIIAAIAPLILIAGGAAWYFAGGPKSTTLGTPQPTAASTPAELARQAAPEPPRLAAAHPRMASK